MRRYLMILCTALLSCACAQEIEQVEVYELGCPRPAVKKEAQQDTAAFKIYSNGEYSGVIDAEWLSVDEFPGQRKFIGSGDGTLTLSFTHNEGDTRTGTVTLTRHTRTVTLTVVQRGDLTVDPGVLSELTASSSSTLTFRFGEGDTVSEQYSYPYSFGLFADEAMQDTIVFHKVPKGTLIWNKAMPAFTFGGLERGTDYYFQVHNPETDKRSEPMKVSTTEFEVVAAGVNDMAEGNVILAEDFSELPWNGDDVNGAAGWRAKDSTVFAMPSGTSAEGYFGNRSYESPLIDKTGCGVAFASSRLSDWCVADQAGAPAGKTIFVRPGYLKLGGYSYVPALVTPELGEVPSGKSATVEVEFTASRYSSDNPSVVVAAVKGSNNGTSFSIDEVISSSKLDLNSIMGWNSSYSVTLEGIGSGTRIMIGPDVETTGNGYGKSQQRMYLDDIRVTVTGLQEVLGLEVKACYTDAKASWNAVNADSFNVYVGGVKVGTTEETSWHLTGLSHDTSYTVAVKPVVGGLENAGESVEIKTHGVRVVEQARTHICVEWDDLVTTEVKTQYVSGKSTQDNIDLSNKEGQDRAYEMVLYADQTCTQPLVTLYPYDGIFLDRFIFNDGAYLRTGSNAQYWTGVSAGVPRRMATRISIGCLEPGTDYWFRVRSVEKLEVSGTRYKSTMTNPAGTSEWSAPLKVSTSPERVSLQNEVIFNGFDQFSIQKDQHNLCSGIQPAIAHDATAARKAFDGTLLKNGEYEFTLLAWRGQGDFKKTHDYGFVSQVEGNSTDDPYFRASTFGGKNNYVDKSGWHFIGNTSPEMGYLHLDTGPDVAVGTPALESGLSADTETPCQLTFNAFAIHQTYQATATAKVKVAVYRDGTLQQEKEMTIPYKYKNQSPSAKDFIPDTSWNEYSAELSLKKGDAVLIFNNAGSYRWMIDDILILKK